MPVGKVNVKKFSNIVYSLEFNFDTKTNNKASKGSLKYYISMFAQTWTWNKIHCPRRHGNNAINYS